MPFFPLTTVSLGIWGKHIEDLLPKHNLLFTQWWLCYTYVATTSASATDLGTRSVAVLIYFWIYAYSRHWWRWWIWWKHMMIIHVEATITGSQYAVMPRPHFICHSLLELSKADWHYIIEYASRQLGAGNSIFREDEFSDRLIDIATNIIPKTKFSVRKINTKWWNDECKEAVADRKRELGTKSQLSLQTLYKIIKARQNRKTVIS